VNEAAEYSDSAAVDASVETVEAKSTPSAEAPAKATLKKEEVTVAGAKEITISIPQIAYSYKYGYRLGAADITKAQTAHVALCEKSGPKVCRVLNMENNGSEGDYAEAKLHLEVAAPQARAFGEKLAKAVEKQGGDQIAASISGEDLSKAIVDTEARLRSRELLAQRLTELLRTKSGSVAELVEAERAVTQVNEEIDQARSWLKEMTGRVAFSKVEVNYQSDAPGSGGFVRPIREAFGEIGSIFGMSIGLAITFLAGLLPWALMIAAIIYLRRRFKSPNRSFFGRKLAEINESVSPPE
jgi:hypothetical protein